MNVLDSYFSAEEIKGLEEQAESFLRQDETFDSVSKMICTDDAYETQNQIKFYFTLDDGTLLFTNYKKEEKKFLFWTQEKEYADTAIAPIKFGASLDDKKIAVGPSAPPIIPMAPACIGSKPMASASI